MGRMISGIEGAIRRKCESCSCKKRSPPDYLSEGGWQATCCELDEKPVKPVEPKPVKPVEPKPPTALPAPLPTPPPTSSPTLPPKVLTAPYLFKCYHDYLECDHTWFHSILDRGFTLNSNTQRLDCGSPYGRYGGFHGFSQRKALMAESAAECHIVVGVMNEWQVGTFKCSEWIKVVERYGKTYLDRQARYITMDQCSYGVQFFNSNSTWPPTALPTPLPTPLPTSAKPVEPKPTPGSCDADPKQLKEWQKMIRRAESSPLRHNGDTDEVAMGRMISGIEGAIRRKCESCSCKKRSPPDYLSEGGWQATCCQ